MSSVVALLRKNLLESRWMLGLLSSGLFSLAWLFVFVSRRIESNFRTTGRAPMGMLRGLGGPSMDSSSAAVEMAFWNHPFILLMFALWAIARGSGAVAGEIEKGTMDLVLSRPVSRTAFLSTQILFATLGLILMAAAMVAGNLVGVHYNTLDTPATFSQLLKPAINLVAFGWAIFGYTLLCSTLDLARWRPTLIGSVATLAGFIAHVVANIPSLEDWKWVDHLSIFNAYDPVELVVKGDSFGFNAGILGLVGFVAIALGYVVFLPRDLPANS
jgi:ABC-2 type transport system permease protein